MIAADHRAASATAARSSGCGCRRSMMRRSARRWAPQAIRRTLLPCTLRSPDRVPLADRMNLSRLFTLLGRQASCIAAAGRPGADADARWSTAIREIAGGSVSTVPFWAIEVARSRHGMSFVAVLDAAGRATPTIAPAAACSS